MKNPPHYPSLEGSDKQDFGLTELDLARREQDSGMFLRVGRRDAMLPPASGDLESFNLADAQKFLTDDSREQVEALLLAEVDAQLATENLPPLPDAATERPTALETLDAVDAQLAAETFPPLPGAATERPVAPVVDINTSKTADPTKHPLYGKEFVLTDTKGSWKMVESA